MIKVLHYLSNLGLGGTEKTCQLFADYLNPDLFEVALAYKEDGPRGDLFRRIPHLQMFHLDESEPGFGLSSLVTCFDPDVLHVYRSGFPEFPEPGQDVKVRNFVETNVFGLSDPNPNVDKTLFMSEWLLNYVVPFRGSERFDFVNNPVEEPHTDDVLDVATRWRNEGAIILGRCGRPDNGIYHAINVRAASLLRMQGHDVRFIVMAPPSNMIDDLTEWDIPFYSIDPTVDPVALSTFYNSVDIYAHARADGETFGVNIAEAMMHSKPVVTHVAEPSVPGMGVFQSQTTLVDHERTGYVCPNDVGVYTQALATLIDNPEQRLRMGKAGYHKAFSEYHATVCTQKLERIYRELVNSSKGY